MPEISPEMLRAWRQSRGLNQDQMARRLVGVQKQYGLEVKPLDNMRRYVYRWESSRDARLPDEEFQLQYMLAFGLASLEDLARGPATCMPSPDREGAAGIYDLLASAADESATYASAEASAVVAPLTILQLTVELQRLACRRANLPALELIAQTRRLRDESRRLSQRTREPGQLADLYLITGAACGLLAMLSWNLGAWPAATEQAHAAGLYGQLAGHRGLQAWAAGSEGLIAFWLGRPREGADAVARGLEIAPRGTARARLHCIAARAWACLGAVDRTAAEISNADRARDEARAGHCREQLHDEIGGEYSWDGARHAMCAATALLVAGDTEGASLRAREAIRRHAEGEAFNDLVSAKAHADLACAELAGSQLDAATDALGPVWDVPPAFRTYPLVGRLQTMSAVLSEAPFTRSHSATELAERIRVFSAESALAPAARGVLLPGGQ
jgi:transcriptional regulator with XRE-family HTH domain